jgi:ribulose-phosphate 3-epimerase
LENGENRKMKDKKYLLRSPHDPFTITPYSDLHAHIGNNVGNLVYVAGVTRALMITDNTEFITVHYEACSDLKKTLAHIHSLGVKAGVSVKPKTAPEVLDEYLDDIDLILVMSVEPGFGGQKFMPDSLEKIRYYSALKEEKGYSYVIEIDGGVGAGNADIVREAGTELIVAGSAVFGAKDRAEAVSAIKGGK